MRVAGLTSTKPGLECVYETCPASDLSSNLGSVLINRAQIVLFDTLLTLIMRGLDYSGSLLNYGLIAVAVFITGFGSPEGSSSGTKAALVSKGSFYMLTLVYSFSQLLDVGKFASEVLGLAARVGELMLELETFNQTGGERGEGDDGDGMDGGYKQKGIGVFGRWLKRGRGDPGMDGKGGTRGGTKEGKIGDY